jgi:hypothetical protein
VKRTNYFRTSASVFIGSIGILKLGSKSGFAHLRKFIRGGYNLKIKINHFLQDLKFTAVLYFEFTVG